jgi:hypothetical protein
MVSTPRQLPTGGVGAVRVRCAWQSASNWWEHRVGEVDERKIKVEALALADDLPFVNCDALLPDWEAQKHRFYVPCMVAPHVHWRREVVCMTLGGLFAVLGHQHDAALLYYFYRTRRVVALKMRPGKGRR